MQVTISDLKELSPFLAVIASILALIFGPLISGGVARKQAIASMQERWIYAFRDCLVDLITEFDILHEIGPTEGLPADDNYEEIAKRLRVLANRARLMVNPTEPHHVELLGAIEKTIDMLVMGIKSFDEFHQLNDKVKCLAQQAIRDEWKKIATN
jgi:hypothetical protein